MHDKRRRQAALLRLVRQRSVANQRELVRMLRKDGFPVTQASVSRDLRELGLVKLNGAYRPVTRIGGSHGAAGGDALHELITSVAPAGANLIVVRTRVGAASTVAVEIDRRQCPEIIGTIAGDDTILVAVRSRSAQGRAVALLKRLSATE